MAAIHPVTQGSRLLHCAMPSLTILWQGKKILGWIVSFMSRTRSDTSLLLMFLFAIGSHMLPV